MVPKEEFPSLQALPSREPEMQQMWQKHIAIYVHCMWTKNNHTSRKEQKNQSKEIETAPNNRDARLPCGEY